MSRAATMAAEWTRFAALLLVAHGALHVFLAVRPGRVAVLPFVLAPTLLLALTMLTIAAAAYDVLHRGWRTLFRRAFFVGCAALIASLALSLLTYRVYPSSYDGRPAAACFALPIDGDIAVIHGGASVATNYHVAAPAQRYAYDLAVSRDGATYRGEGYVIWDYYAYGQPVRAPLGGRVVAAVDGDPDQSPSDLDWQPRSTAGGNHVVIEVGPKQFLFLAHLQPGSIRVKPGDSVTVGAVVGAVGNSGRSGAPHLHVHLQDTPEPNDGEGIPMEFCRYEVVSTNGVEATGARIERGMPTGKNLRQVIRAAP